MTLMLTLVLILVILIVVDLYRKSLRIKQKVIISDIKENDQLYLNQVNSYLTDVEGVRSEYPLLKEGYLLLYLSFSKSIKLKTLVEFLKYHEVEYTEEKIFQKLNYNDVIFSILPDNKKQETGIRAGQVNSIVTVMNYKKLSEMDYDSKACYELMIDILDELSKSFNGTLMNEHKIRLTKKDKRNYIEAIL